MTKAFSCGRRSATLTMRISGVVVTTGGLLASLIDKSAGFVGPRRVICSESNIVRAHDPSSRTSNRCQVAVRVPRKNNGAVGVLGAWRGDRLEEYDGYDDYDEYDDDFKYRGEETMRRREQERAKRPLLPSKLSNALVAGVFVLGIGTGVTVDSAINTDPRDLASRDAIDRNAPNPNICQTYGSSAMVVDQRVFVTFNPFSLHVSQADTKPGCVLRPANVVEVLQRRRNLLTNEDVESCKSGMNTWAFVGDLNDHPQLSCVYQSDDAQNEFLSNPKYGLGEDVYDDDRAAAAKREGPPVEAANGPRVMSGTIQTVVTERSRM